MTQVRPVLPFETKLLVKPNNVGRGEERDVGTTLDPLLLQQCAYQRSANSLSLSARIDDYIDNQDVDPIADSSRETDQRTAVIAFGGQTERLTERASDGIWRRRQPSDRRSKVDIFLDGHRIHNIIVASS